MQSILIKVYEMNSPTPSEVIIFIKFARLRKVGNVLLMITNMFEPPHEYYVTEISTAIHSDRQLHCLLPKQA